VTSVFIRSARSTLLQELILFFKKKEAREARRLGRGDRFPKADREADAQMIFLISRHGKVRDPTSGRDGIGEDGRTGRELAASPIQDVQKKMTSSASKSRAAKGGCWSPAKNLLRKLIEQGRRDFFNRRKGGCKCRLARTECT